MEKFQITEPPPSLGLGISECQWKWNISIGHYEKIEKWLPFHKYQSCGKFSNYQPPPPKFGSLSVEGNGISASAIMKC